MRLALLLTQILPVFALPSLNRAACQHPTRNPLSGCPAGTLLVGPNAPFRTIQSAVLSLANTTTASHILVLPGNYTEQVNITLPAPLYLLGQTASPRSRHANAVNVIWRNATGAGIVPNIDNAYTSTLTVAPTLNASLTGTGPTGFAVPADTPFGSADFRAYNLNFINDFADHAVGPALAVSVSYANAGFYFCGFYSYQDTVSFALSLSLSITAPAREPSLIIHPSIHPPD
jgi:pectin methylesterase-like acyl-CoA thioesterase